MELKANDYKPKEIIKIMREWTELTQREFAKTINRSHKTIEAYEYGNINISLATLLKVANKHGIEIVIRKK